MRLRPNPPRLITVAIAVALGVVGLVFALPYEPGVALHEPLVAALGSIGLDLDRELAFLFLFASPTLLVVGSLLPGI